MLTRKNVLWVITGRLLVATAVLGVGAATDSFVPTFLGWNWVLIVLSFIYLLSSFYLLWAILSSSYATQLRVHLTGDLVAVTFLVFLSGEVTSPYTSLYLVVIAYSALLGGKRDGYAAAASSTILYVGMIDLSHFGVIPFFPVNLPFETLNFRIAVVVLGFVTVTYLSTTLSRRLSKVHQELEEKSGSLADLRVLNDNIVNSLRSGLITTDLPGHVRRANRAASTLTEIPIDELEGRPLHEVLNQEFMSWMTQIKDGLQNESHRKEFWFQTSSGRRKYLGFSVSPLFNQKDDLIGHITSFQDLTEIKRLEEEIVIKEKMAALGQMAAALAHEIRNPLASMHGSIQVLQKDLRLENEDRHLMDIVLRESNRLNKIIEDFLAYARPRKAELTRLDITEIIRETMSLLKNHPAFHRDHELEFLLDSSQPQILGDADLMKQVCWNLATNGLKAMPMGGRLSIDTRSSSEKMVRLRFSDQGVGMDKGQQERIFHPFHGNFSEGLGIGMAIVYQIVNHHGGRVHVQSARGSGTTVELEFARV